MATCALCKIEETELHENGMPTCLKCSDTHTAARKPSTSASVQHARAILLQEVLRATALNEEALLEFDKVVSRVPNSIPLPDGGRRIISATRKLAMARNEMVMSHNRLSDCLEHGAVPEDVRKSA